MKTLEQLFEEVKADKALKAELIQAVKDGKTEEFFKAHDCKTTTEKAIEFAKAKIATGELTIPAELIGKLIWG